ncbi:hypothetical protein NKH16_20160 [Mesorhizobium sp. M1307]|uniref:hypothetical protein n=1 Tax=unclassified Mesorhizobium TaxID=325217 RepID=UPI003335108A
MKAAALFQIALIVAFIYGWVVNLIDVIHLFSSDAPLTTSGIIRIIGIPVGFLGAILGWL